MFFLRIDDLCDVLVIHGVRARLSADTETMLDDHHPRLIILILSIIALKPHDSRNITRNANVCGHNDSQFSGKRLSGVMVTKRLCTVRGCQVRKASSRAANR
jgi:hypothetical protein